MAIYINLWYIDVHLWSFLHLGSPDNTSHRSQRCAKWWLCICFWPCPSYWISSSLWLQVAPSFCWPLPVVLTKWSSAMQNDIPRPKSGSETPSRQRTETATTRSNAKFRKMGNVPKNASHDILNDLKFQSQLNPKPGVAVFITEASCLCETLISQSLDHAWTSQVQPFRSPVLYLLMQLRSQNPNISTVFFSGFLAKFEGESPGWMRRTVQKDWWWTPPPSAACCQRSNNGITSTSTGRKWEGKPQKTPPNSSWLHHEIKLCAMDLTSVVSKTELFSRDKVAVILWWISCSSVKLQAATIPFDKHSQQKSVDVPNSCTV